MSIAKDARVSKQQLGQFLTPINVARKVLDGIHINPSDKVLELSDLVRVADHDALSRVVTQALMNKECVTTVEQLCTDKGYFIDDLVPLSDVFYCSDHCLHFVYQPYEIACFAAGIIDIEVWDYLLEDAGLLTPLGKRVLTK